MKHLLIYCFVLLCFAVPTMRLNAQCDPPPFIDAGPDILLACPTPWDTLVGTAEAGATFLWTGPNGIIATTPDAYINQTGTYTLTITALNGCTAQDQVVVTGDVTLPVITSQNVQSPTCIGNDGSIALEPNPNAQFLWSNGQVGPTNNNLSPGLYCVTVVDNNNACTATECYNLTQPNPLNVGVQQELPVSCAGEANGLIIGFASGGTPPYNFTWTGPNGFTAQQNNVTQVILNNLEGGAYLVTVTDANGCSSISLDSLYEPLAIDLSSFSICQDGIFPQYYGGTPPFTFTWSNGNTTPILTGIPAGTYTMTLTDAYGCSAEQTYTLGVNDPECTQIKGRVGSDEDGNCLATTDDPALGNIFVKATGGGLVFFGVTDAQGEYIISVPPGTYVLSIDLPGITSCPGPTTVSLPNGGDMATANFALQGVGLDCPQMEVSIAAAILRRCITGHYYIQYCNNSIVVAEDAYVVITLDPFLSAVNASQPYTDLGNNQIRFDLGDMAAFECDNIWLNVQVSCDAVLGQTHCTEAHIYPDTACDNNFTGAVVNLQANCAGDSLHFIITNVGDETMSEELKYIVIEDGIMTLDGMSNPLAPTESMTVSLPGNGSTWRLEAEQEATYPGEDLPILSVEGCTTDSSFSTGFVGQFATNDNPSYIDVDCRENQGSYDPNDKQGFPIGYGTAHYIKPGTEIEYTIRFQNTGTDTAFTVAIRDTLSQWLDLTSVEVGASSHDYRWSVMGSNVLMFDFPNILLPDSNVNQAGSQGFIRFRLRPKANTPLETDIFNSAAIYFDFNEPVITNTTQHRIGLNFVSVSAWQPVRAQYDVTIAPHPLQNTSWLTVENAPANGDYRLRVYDAQGKMVTEKQADQARFELQRYDMTPGLYFFEIILNGASAGSGKLMVH
ncbi:MAG: T9SS type A sorting domain-containing protein [Saprospiraceae bacterium]|nr:T9SS type A sorting domain-containing protein [Saprospiraceae bacterium]